MRRLAQYLASAFFCLLSVSARAQSPDDVAVTWSQGRAVVPAAVSPTRAFAIHELPGDLASSRSLPAIVYMHGSDGLLDGASDLARALSDGGFAVFMPDSFKRPGRIANCDPNTRVCGAWPEVYRHRLEEIAHAAKAIAQIPFVDPARIVLLGHSEGGIAVAQYRGGGFAGIVISGWHCGPSTRSRDKYLGDFAGIKAPSQIPVLSIYSRRDPWFAERGGLDVDCSRYFAGRASSRAILEPGDVHYMLGRTDMRAAIIDFARATTAAPR